ncbi:MAG TPA: hypothetical protein VGI51_07655 [Steroidobacteraceae bacterium]|jgi:ElaB/YqjD/DUF883 family membrane-anchored ribosome-binding protein
MNARVATVVGSNGAGRAKAAVETPYEQLFDGVDDLIRRVADTENPEIRKVRAKVHAALVAAKSAYQTKSEVERDANWVRREPIQVAGGELLLAESIGDDFGDYDGQTLGVALLVGLGLGLIASVRQ